MNAVRADGMEDAAYRESVGVMSERELDEETRTWETIQRHAQTRSLRDRATRRLLVIAAEHAARRADEISAHGGGR